MLTVAVLESSCEEAVDEGVLLLRLRRFAPSFDLTATDRRLAEILRS